MGNTILKKIRNRWDKYSTLTTDKLKKTYGYYMVLRHGFWFVDIPRTSSSSIRVELGRKFGMTYGKKSLLCEKYSVPLIMGDHIPAQQLIELFGNITWQRIYTFTIVRNPWARILSCYYYRKKISNIPTEWTFNHYIMNLDKALQTKDYDQKDTLYFGYHGFRYGASDYILSKDGQMLVDYVAKYENRTADLKVIAKKLNFPELGKLKTQQCTPENTDYRKYYNKDTKRIIEKWYTKDIELFGYNF